MAKLEDKITPDALLLAIRSGRRKNEMVGEYRTSPEELAMMLLPLYRVGKLTKDEFNNFFRGMPISGEPETTEDVATPVPQMNINEPPTEFFRVFSSVFSRKRSLQENAGADELTAGADTAVIEDTQSSVTDEFSEPKAHLETSVDTLDIETAELPDLPERRPPEVEPEYCLLDDASAVALNAPDQKLAPDPPQESAHLKKDLEKILVALAAIETRLSQIENKLRLE